MPRTIARPCQADQVLLIGFVLVSALFAQPDVEAGETILVPDRYRSIQAAIDAAKAGDTVLVSPGTYAERIALASGVIVRSAGDNRKGKLGLRRAEATVLDGGGQGGREAGVIMAEGSVLDGFTVTRVGLYDEARWQKHFATSGNQQQHEHIGVPGTPGIQIEAVNCTVTNNIVHHIGYTGIAILGHADRRAQPHVTHNVCYRNMGGGIGCMRRANGLIKENLCFENFYAGIGHNNAGPTVVNNVCRNNIRAGIGISEGSCPIVRGNQCFENRRAGIGVRTGSETRPLIEDNDCYANGMAGIGTEEEAEPTIRNNRCYRNTLAGIGSRHRARSLIVDNECYENGAAGIGQESDAVTTLIGNHCHHNKLAGLGFAACDHGESRVIGNVIVDNAKVAAGVGSGWTVTFSKNELVRKDGLPPIVMIFAGARVTLTENLISGGGVAGVRVAGEARIVGNRIEGTVARKQGPPNFAVWGLPGSSVTMNDNSVSNWRHGLHATDSVIHASHNTVRSFHGHAFVVSQPRASVSVINNTATSDDPRAQVLSLLRGSGVVRGNRVQPVGGPQK